MKNLQRLFLLFALAIALPAWSATATGTLAISATLVASCTITGTPLSFGTTIPAPVVANIDVAGSITATCTTGAPYNIGANAGIGVGATITNRRMTAGGNTMIYSLFRDAARTLNWGNTVGTDTIAGTGTGVAQVISVFGRIPSGQNVPAGAYADTITLTITF